MYRALSSQLRILPCDSPKPLLVRLFPNLQLQSLQSVTLCQPGAFPPELQHLNSLTAAGPGHFVLSLIPFEARVFAMVPKTVVRCFQQMGRFFQSICGLRKWCRCIRFQ